MESINPVQDAARLRTRAKAIKTRLGELGVEMKLGQAYEVQAIAMGYANWATLVAMQERGEVSAGIAGQATTEMLSPRAYDAQLADIVAELVGILDSKHEAPFHLEHFMRARSLVHHHAGLLAEAFPLYVKGQVKPLPSQSSVASHLEKNILDVTSRFYVSAIQTALFEAVWDRICGSVEMSVERAVLALADGDGLNEAKGFLMAFLKLEDDMKAALDGSHADPFEKVAARYGTEFPRLSFGVIQCLHNDFMIFEDKVGFGGETTLHSALKDIHDFRFLHEIDRNGVDNGIVKRLAQRYRRYCS